MRGSCVYVFFFFKQKTAYEMRISDWRSDVCSSDLEALPHAPVRPRCRVAALARAVGPGGGPRLASRPHWRPGKHFKADDTLYHGAMKAGHISEEHTSELQSLMRISYAVFCFKKKTN